MGKAEKKIYFGQEISWKILEIYSESFEYPKNGWLVNKEGKHLNYWDKEFHDGIIKDLKECYKNIKNFFHKLKSF